MTTINPSQSTASYESIKLGIDAHAQHYWVSRQVDGATPQPVQKMTYDELMLFVVKQQKLTRNVVTCYEASAFRFHLDRRLEELGIKNYLVQPQDWDERGKGVKNDRLDAAALCLMSALYEMGAKVAEEQHPNSHKRTERLIRLAKVGTEVPRLRTHEFPREIRREEPVLRLLVPL
jgi:transposase